MLFLIGFTAFFFFGGFPGVSRGVRGVIWVSWVSFEPAVGAHLLLSEQNACPNEVRAHEFFEGQPYQAKKKTHFKIRFFRILLPMSSVSWNEWNGVGCLPPNTSNGFKYFAQLC